MNGSGDNNPNSQGAQDPEASLQRQNERLQLLLNLTSRVTSNLDLREVLRAISANFREVMRCDGAGVWLPGEESGTFKLYAFDSPVSKGFAKEELIITPAENDPGKRAFETMKPMVATVEEIGWPGGGEGYRLAAAEGVKSACFIPLVSRGRALGDLMIVRKTEETFTAEDVDFLNQAAGQIAIAIENALAYREISELKDKLAQEKLYLEEEIRSEMDFEQIVGSSAALKHVLQLVETVAPNDSTVLLLGETGTGKELIARAIHDRSRRKERTLVKLNCAAIPTGLLESELFGHEKGAFTGAISQKIGRMELADQGTLFLDEVGDIPTDIQPKLLRALQEREFERLGSTHTRRVSIRLIAATNRDLEKMVANREFRSDLFYRLNVFPIRIPALRERREDIPLLVSYFVQKFAKDMQKKIGTIPTATMKGLAAWEWPGNIRELENFMERAVILTRGESLEAPLSELRRPSADTTHLPAAQPVHEDIARIVKETINAALNGKKPADEYAQKQREEIVHALAESNGRVGGANGAAARMGIHRTTLISRMKKLGIDPRQYTA
jgi:formate hydrogenlyase transcriptional activator